MLELFPEGFEESEREGSVELAAYTDPGGEERLWFAFGGARSDEVAEDWAERWKGFHRPVRAGALWVGPPWELQPHDAIAVVIEPGRAFGTGSHATTLLCLELLQELPRGSLLDVGCGSGVLAIGAARLGFAPVLALDIDPAAVEATFANASANGVQVDVALQDATATALPPVDAAVANIALDAVAVVGEAIEATHFVTSGYFGGDSPSLGRFRHVEERSSNGWRADLWELRTK